MQNAVGEPADAVVSDGDMLLAAFDSHLQHVAGLMPGTRVQYLRHVTYLNNAQAHLILATCVNETDGRALLLLVAFP
jgi:hypothetical protein